MKEVQWIDDRLASSKNQRNINRFTLLYVYFLVFKGKEFDFYVDNYCQSAKIQHFDVYRNYFENKINIKKYNSNPKYLVSNIDIQKLINKKEKYTGEDRQLLFGLLIKYISLKDIGGKNISFALLLIAILAFSLFFVAIVCAIIKSRKDFIPTLLIFEIFSLCSLIYLRKEYYVFKEKYTDYKSNCIRIDKRVLVDELQLQYETLKPGFAYSTITEEEAQDKFYQVYPFKRDFISKLQNLEWYDLKSKSRKKIIRENNTLEPAFNKYFCMLLKEIGLDKKMNWKLIAQVINIVDKSNKSNYLVNDFKDEKLKKDYENFCRYLKNNDVY